MAFWPHVMIMKYKVTIKNTMIVPPVALIVSLKIAIIISSKKALAA